MIQSADDIVRDAVIQAEAYDLEGKLLKEFDPKKVKKNHLLFTCVWSFVPPLFVFMCSREVKPVSGNTGLHNI